MDAEAVEHDVVVDQHLVVGGDVYVELAAPELIELCLAQRSNGILHETGLFAVPETSVGCDGDLLFFLLAAKQSKRDNQSKEN